MQKAQSKSLYLIGAFLLSFLIFRGRLGSDDIEVYNFVKYFIYSDLNLKDFIANIVSNSYTSEENLQNFSVSTWSHRFVWITQTYIITKIIFIFDIFFDFNKEFISKYFSGYILTFYTFFAFLIVLFDFQKRQNVYYSFFLCSIIFFGTGLISFFTGAYIESLILLLFVSRQVTQNYKKIFIYDLIIILIKPYYFIYLIFLYFLNNKGLIKNIPLVVSLLLSFILIKLFINSFSSTENVSFFLSFMPNFDFYFVMKNLISFYFSLGMGIFFTSTIVIILIIFGYSNKTILKIFGLFFLSIFFCFWEGFHGYAPGGRYFLPIVVTFLPEIETGFNKIVRNINKFKFKIVLNILFFLLISNLSTLEYRNTNLVSYINNTVNKNTGNNFVLMMEDNKFTLLNTPIQSISYNHIIFSNKVVINKLLNKNRINVDINTIDLNNIYPMTGIGRLIFISNQNIILYGDNLKKFSDSIKLILIILYIITAVIFLYFVFISFINLKKS